MKDIKEIKDYQIILLGVFIALGALLSTIVLSNAVISYQKLNKQALSVTGSASRNVKSDLAVWKAYYQVRSKDLKSGYAKIDQDKKAVTDFLVANGMNEKDIHGYHFTDNPMHCGIVRCEAGQGDYARDSAEGQIHHSRWIFSRY